METLKFLQKVITTNEGYFLLANRVNGHWIEHWFKWPDDGEAIVEFAAHLAGDIYFSSHLFSTCKSEKCNVLPTYTIQADLDEALVNNLPFEPTLLVRTSEGRHHAYWHCSAEVTEELSKAITYSIYNCDLSGWTLGHRMRLPNTQNFKYNPPHKCEVVEDSLNVITAEQIQLLPKPEAEPDEGDMSWVNDVVPNISTGPFELLESIKHGISIKVYNQYDKLVDDRSAYLWSLINAALRNNLTLDETFTLAYNSVNNKFKGLANGGVRELKKDIIRAKTRNKTNSEDIQEAVSQLRKIPGFAFEKKSSVAKLVIDVMQGMGIFSHTDDDNLWYTVNLTGRPVQVSSTSIYLESLLHNTFGLNPSETEAHYTYKAIEAHCRNLPADTAVSSISYYDEVSNTLYLHSGRRDVFKITADDFTTLVNGSNKIVFPWNQLNTPFFPAEPEGIEWKHILLERVTNNVLNMDQKQAAALIEVWFIFLLMRNSCVARPILALFGQPGAGKSTLFKRIYTLLYGRNRELGGVTKPEDFDHAVSTDPLVVLDNVDTWERWLPDRLAQSAASSDIIKRRLYTDNDSFIQRRQAILGITAHNPKFGREDVADRLLIISFERLKSFLPEKFILDTIGNYRSRIWMSIIRDVQKVLATSPPTIHDLPQFRIEDFAALGIRIARGLGLEDDFKASLGQVYLEQRLFSLEEESILVGAMQNYAAKCKTKGTLPWLTPADMWSELSLSSVDPMMFNRTYKNAVTLARKVWAMQESLKTVFFIDYKIDPMKGTRVFQIGVKLNG